MARTLVPMNLIDLSLIALVGIICGTSAQLTSGSSKGGWIVNLALGFFGALVGVFVSRSLNAPVVYDLKVAAVTFPLIYCILGAVLCLAAISLFMKPGSR
jgi:uncharacterized membrane protein YeaQ/YmgE (transglycosylase-associated protein family)